MKKPRAVHALLLTLCCAAAQADGVPWSGSGTEAAPWLITSAADLVALRDYVAAGENTTGMYFMQTADISLSTVCGEGKGDGYEKTENAVKVLICFSFPVSVDWQSGDHSVC